MDQWSFTPGTVYRRDYRRVSGQPADISTATIKLLQWNIERGYQLAGIIEELRRLDADVISLQEVDVGCERSGGIDVGAAIAEALQLNYVFLPEFEELHSPVRAPRDQGGGVHGNAVLTKLDISEVHVVQHRVHPVDWNDPTHPCARREPRRGQRAVLRAALATPQGPALVVYCAHFEVFCGLLARVAQLADIFADARRMADRGFHHQTILGDLNTMAHGVARLSPRYCCDRMRMLSLGRDEGVMWERYILAVHDPRYSPLEKAGARQAGERLQQQQQQQQQGEEDEERQEGERRQQEELPGGARGAAACHAQQPQAGAPSPPPVNAQLLRWGLPPEFARDAVNPGFACPFPAAATATLDNPTYRWLGRSWMKGKLDWALLRRAAVVRQAVGNDDYSLSDHRWLLAEVRLE